MATRISGGGVQRKTQGEVSFNRYIIGISSIRKTHMSE